jgi:hypothetical protein
MLIDDFIKLPKMISVPRTTLYIRGYTEALSFYSDVRVIPNEDWLQGELRLLLRKHLRLVKPPLYLIPVFRDNNCYNFVLKGAEKYTPRVRESSSYLSSGFVPGIERIQKGDVVVFCEGFKDSFIFLRLGMKCLPMLTSNPSFKLLQFFKSLNCKLIFVPDNEENTNNFVESYTK